MIDGITTVASAKMQARMLRSALAVQGVTISHGQALELVARQNGARDWNTLSAKLGESVNVPYRIGQKVSGRYLGQTFTGLIHAVAVVGDALYALTVRFDIPVDVVTFSSFSALRRQIRGTVDKSGRSPQRTTNGMPQLVIDMP